MKDKQAGSKDTESRVWLLVAFGVVCLGYIAAFLFHLESLHHE